MNSRLCGDAIDIEPPKKRARKQKAQGETNTMENAASSPQFEPEAQNFDFDFVMNQGTAMVRPPIVSRFVLQNRLE